VDIGGKSRFSIARLESGKDPNIMVQSLFDHWACGNASAREAVMSDQTAVVPREQVATERRQQTEQQSKRQPPYNVILWNDNDHTYEYVITMLMELFAYPPEKGFQMAKEVDTQGQVIVLTTTREHAELKRDQIHAYGKDKLIASCKGSMWATIEPTE
jgi:ATP-dependent Clp protease adaptor protein ClpS